MKIKIASQEYNPLFKRKEVIFEVEHEEMGGTPSRFEVRKRLSSLLKEESGLVYVKRLETKTGTNIAVGEANIYSQVKQAHLIEPEYIIARNAPEKSVKKGE